MSKLSYLKEIIAATGNRSKFADFNIYIGNAYKLRLPTAEELIEVPEGIASIEENALAKARAYAAKFNRVAIGDDTGFFIEALHGEPGVALRRWGGELPEDTSQETFWSYLQQKTKDLSNLDAYFNQCIAIAVPDGRYHLIFNKNKGKLNRRKLQLPYNGTAYPLADAFESDDRAKTWDEMTDDEKRQFDARIIREIQGYLETIF